MSRAVEVYCDESRPELMAGGRPSAKFTLIGSLWIPAEDRPELKAQIHQLRNYYDCWGEAKWSKISSSKLDFYTDLVDVFLDHPSAQFRCIAIEATLLDLARFHNDDGELGFYKFYYQLLYHWIRPGRGYRVFCDQKVNRDRARLSTLATVLQNACKQSSIAGIHAVDSKESSLTQVCDLLLGASQARANGSIESSSAKQAVLKYVEDRIGRSISPTPASEEKFNVFRIRLAGSV